MPDRYGQIIPWQRSECTTENTRVLSILYGQGHNMLLGESIPWYWVENINIYVLGLKIRMIVPYFGANFENTKFMLWAD